GPPPRLDWNRVISNADEDSPVAGDRRCVPLIRPYPDDGYQPQTRALHGGVAQAELSPTRPPVTSGIAMRDCACVDLMMMVQRASGWAKRVRFEPGHSPGGTRSRPTRCAGGAPRQRCHAA